MSIVSRKYTADDRDKKPSKDMDWVTSVAAYRLAEAAPKSYSIDKLKEAIQYETEGIQVSTSDIKKMVKDNPRVFRKIGNKYTIQGSSRKAIVAAVKRTPFEEYLEEADVDGIFEY